MKNLLNNEEVKLKRLYIDEINSLESDEELIFDFDNYLIEAEDYVKEENNKEEQNKKGLLPKLYEKIKTYFEEVLNRGFEFMLACIKGF